MIHLSFVDWLRAAPVVALILQFLVALNLGEHRGRWVTQDDEPRSSTRFAAIDLFIDSGNDPLAAWQVEFHATKGVVRIVGIESGEHAVFGDDPPYYDPDAMMNDRVILAQYSLGRADSLPTGRTRIATVHVQIEGEMEPQFSMLLQAAGDDEGCRIAAEVTFEMRIDQ